VEHEVRDLERYAERAKEGKTFRKDKRSKNLHKETLKL
jgi:hypothetical protein